MENSEAGLEEWAKGKFGVGGSFTGQLYGNTDWALTRLVWSAALEYAAKDALEKLQYPGCDYCKAALSYHPWHGSGEINGKLSRHIHACDDCKHLLP